MHSSVLPGAETGWHKQSVSMLETTQITRCLLGMVPRLPRSVCAQELVWYVTGSKACQQQPCFSAEIGDHAVAYRVACSACGGTTALLHLWGVLAVPLGKQHWFTDFLLSLEVPVWWCTPLTLLSTVDLFDLTKAVCQICTQISVSWVWFEQCEQWCICTVVV